jgi:hypothetical protein
MATEYSINVDWQEEFEEWENIGASTMREFYEAHPKEAEKDGHDVENGEVTYLDEVIDDWQPMMNYAYPLACDPTRNGNEAIIKVCRETCLTVMYRDSDETYYLALCGGGMDLSQSIAYAYLILESWIPLALLRAVCKQPELSVHGKNWLKMARRINLQLRMEIKSFRQDANQWQVNMREYKISHAKDKTV